MSASNLKLWFCLLGMASLAGCGGSSGTSGGGSGGGNPTTVTFNFNGSANAGLPTVVATQIGTGAYTAATLTSGKLTISIPSGETNFSVAYLCPSPAGNSETEYAEYIRQASILDGTSYNAICFQQSAVQPGTATLQVNAAAIPGAAWVSDGYGEMPWSGSTVDFSLQLNPGTYDIPVSVSSNENFPNNLLAIRILRAQTVPGALNNGAPVVFTASDETLPQPITFSSVPTGFSPANPLVFYQTAGGADIELDQDGPTGQYLAIPSGAVQSGDTYFFVVDAYGSLIGNGSTLPSVGIEKYTPTGGAQSFTFPAPWSYAGPTAAALPTFNLAYSGFSGAPNVSDLVNFTWFTGTQTINEIIMSTTPNYQNGSTEMTIPDLSSLTGFLTPPASGTFYWSAEILQGSITGKNPYTGTVQYVGNSGTYTLP